MFFEFFGLLCMGEYILIVKILLQFVFGFVLMEFVEKVEKKGMMIYMVNELECKVYED